MPRITRRRFISWVSLCLAACSTPAPPADTPQAAFQRWEQATKAQDAKAYFEAIVPPNREGFLMNLVSSWRAGDWRASNETKHEALAVVLRKYGLDQLSDPLNATDRVHLDTIRPLPEVLAEVFVVLDGEGPRGVPLWDLVPQPVSLGEVGPVDTFDSAPATATFRAFDPPTMQSQERTDQIRFFRDKEGRWRVSPPGF